MQKTIAAAILAGGKAARFHGLAKGNILINKNISIIQHLINELNKVQIAEKIIVANNFSLYQQYDLPIVPDLRTDCGPLAGIEAALNYYVKNFNAEYRATLFLPCDLPNLSVLEIKTLCTEFLDSNSAIVVATSNHGNDEHPLCVILDNNVLPDISKALNSGIRKVREVWNSFDTKRVDFLDQKAFLNLNSPRDLL